MRRDEWQSTWSRCYILGSDTVSKKVLDQADSLKIISRYGVGIDNIDLQEAERKGITVTVTKNCNTEAVADYAIGLMLATARHICNVDHSLKKGEWKKETGLDLCHKTVGVIGLGAVGRQVIKRLKGFDVRLSAMTNTWMKHTVRKTTLRLLLLRKFYAMQTLLLCMCLEIQTELL